MSGFRRAYGRGPAHLLCVLASLAVAAYALWRVLGLVSDPKGYLTWLAGAIVAHDLVLLPFYTLVGAVAARLIVPPGAHTPLRVAALNHLRVPALLSGLLLLVWLPLVLGLSSATFERASGLTEDVYLGRWLELSAGLFAGSALLFALRARRLVRAPAVPEST